MNMRANANNTSSMLNISAGCVKAAQYQFQQMHQQQHVNGSAQQQQQQFVPPNMGNNYAANVRNSRQAQKFLMNSVSNYYESMAYNNNVNSSNQMAKTRLVTKSSSNINASSIVNAQNMLNTSNVMNNSTIIATESTHVLGGGMVKQLKK